MNTKLLFGLGMFLGFVPAAALGVLIGSIIGLRATHTKFPRDPGDTTVYVANGDMHAGQVIASDGIAQRKVPFELAIGTDLDEPALNNLTGRTLRIPLAAGDILRRDVAVGTSLNYPAPPEEIAEAACAEAEAHSRSASLPQTTQELRAQVLAGAR